jgi:hypothetical protein
MWSMAAVAALTPTPMATGEVLRSIHGLLDVVDTGDVVGGAAAHAVVRGVDRAISRLQAVRLAAVAEADRAGAAEQAGASGTSAWLATVSRTGGAAASRDVRLASALDDGLDQTRDALGSGSVSSDHAQVIAKAMSQLPTQLTPDQRGTIEATLVKRAEHLDPGRLRKVARRSLEALAEMPPEQVDAHEDQVVRSEEDAALARTRLTWHDNRDGTTSGHFTVPTFAASVLVKAVQQIASPRRFAVRAARDAKDGAAHDGRRLSATDVQGDVWDAYRTADGDWAHRYGTAFMELLEHLPTDRLAGKVAATVVVRVDHETLVDATREKAGSTDTGEPMSAGEVRRAACNGGIVPAVLGGASLPLDLGRQERLFTEHQRVALATVYDECAAHGCDRPYAWTELHHEDPWHSGGRTDLRRAVPLCGQHHRLVHHRGYHHEVETDGRGVKTVRFRRRT